MYNKRKLKEIYNENKKGIIIAIIISSSLWIFKYFFDWNYKWTELLAENTFKFNYLGLIWLATISYFTIWLIFYRLWWYKIIYWINKNIWNSYSDYEEIKWWIRWIFFVFTYAITIKLIENTINKILYLWQNIITYNFWLLLLIIILLISLYKWYKIFFKNEKNEKRM